MTLLTAASASGLPLGELAALAALWAGWYLISCARWPWKPCPVCKGAGKRRSPSGRAFRDCPRCGGKGRQLRAGRRLWTTATSKRD